MRGHVTQTDWVQTVSSPRKAGKQSGVVQDRVQGFYPLWVYVPIKNWISKDSFTTALALKVSTPSVHSQVSTSMWPNSCITNT